MNMLQLTSISGLLACGMGVAILGSIKMPLARKLHIDEARVGGLVSMFALAMIPVILGMGFLTDLVGQQQVLIGGAVVMAVSLIVLARAGKYWAALVGVLLLSAGWSAQINVLNVIMPDAFPGETEAYATNLGNTFFGLGAFLTPLAIAFLLRKAGLSAALVVIGVLVLITGGLALGVDFSPKKDTKAPTRQQAAGSTQQAADQPAPAAAETEETAPAAEPEKLIVGGIVDLLANPVMWLLGLCLFFYGPLEASVAAWSTTIMGEKGVKEETASWMLSGFWLAFMLSRLITAFTVQRGSETTLIIALAVASIVVLLAMVFSRTPGLGIATVILAGFVFGPIFPTIMAVLLGVTEDAVKGRAVGLFFAIGGIGWTGVPMLIGAYARKTSVQRAFLIAVGTAVGLSIIAVILAGNVVIE